MEYLESNQQELVRIVKTLRSKKFSKDYTTSLEECEEKEKLTSDLRRYLGFLRNENIPDEIVINQDFPSYLQTHLTAGSEKQFIQMAGIPIKSYHPETVLNTFKYLFYKFKKALYVRIRNNKLEAFIPFTNARYINEWGKLIRPPKGFKTINDFLAHVNATEGRKFNPKRVQRDPSTWYANNCLFRYEYPFVEEDTSIPLLHNMFSELCKNEIVLDMEFFVHKRDFPLRRKDRTESYQAIFGEGRKLVSHNYPVYSHILSFCTTAEHAELCLPTWEDWCLASQPEGKFFTDSCRLYDPTIGQRIAWSEKKPIAVFRGSTTGCGVTVQTNSRLKLVQLSSMGIVDEGDNLPYLDAGITKWNIRPRAINGVLHTIEVDKPPIKALYDNRKSIKYLTPEDQARYKYIVDVDGHVTAFRLTQELSLGSVVLYTDDSKYYTWMTKSLRPWIHYVPIKSDLSDLLEKIKWCKAHDAECQVIAKNARAFYDKYINKDYMLFYIASLLKSLALSPEVK